jgi:hypothetical protein
LQTAIREGRKSTTLRRWDRPRVRAGERAYSPGLGWLAVDAVEPADLAALTDADAAADGFPTRAALLDALAALYPDAATDGKRWFRVRFTPADLHPERGRRADAGRGGRADAVRISRGCIGARGGVTHHEGTEDTEKRRR